MRRCGGLLTGQECAELSDGGHQRRREHHRGVLVHTEFNKGLQVAQLQSQRMAHHDVRCVAKRGRGQVLALGVDDLGPLFPLGLGLSCHGALHALGQLDVLQLDQGDLDAPSGSGDIEDLADVDVDAVGLGQDLIQGVLADHLTQRGLGDLVDGRAYVLDGDHRLHRIDHPVVGDGGHIHTHVVPSDDAL